MITPKESNLVDIINQQHKQALALKARQPMPGYALITKLTSASRRLDSGNAIGVWLKVTFNFGDKGYFIGEISISEIRYDNSINGFSEYFTQIDSTQAGDGQVITYAHYMPAYGNGTYNVRVVANGSKTGKFTIEQVKTQ